MSLTPYYYFVLSRVAKKTSWPWLLGIAMLYYYFGWVFNPLPNDEKLIENFKANRSDFVEAVRRYREYPRSPGKDSSLWFLEGNTLEVYKRAGIDRVYSHYGVWLSNPYSLETAKKIIQEITEKNNRALVHQYGVLQIKPASTPRIDHPYQSDDHTYRWNTLLHGVIWKDYYFFPEAPRIENGELLGPMNHRGKYSSRSRVFPSLNRLPRAWKDFECVYRQIEPQWFLRMCNGH